MKRQPSRSALLLTAASRCSERSLYSLKACVGFPMMQQNKWVGNYLQVWDVYSVDFSLCDCICIQHQTLPFSDGGDASRLS